MMSEQQPGTPAVPGVTRWRERAGGYAEAVRVTLDNIVGVADWISDSGAHCDQYERHLVITESRHGAALGDWVICRDGLEPCFTVLSADLFAATYEPAGSAPPVAAALTAAQCDRLRQMADEWGNAVSAVRDAVELAGARVRSDGDARIIAAARDALKVLEGTEEGGKRG